MTTPTPRDFRLFRLADELRELTTPIGKEAATILERQAMTLLQFHADLAAAQEALEQERRYTRSLVSDPLPESPLRDLGAWLADQLDSDQWANCEANFLIPAIAFLKEAQDARQRAEALAKEAIAIAILLFDAWEDGTPCFETDGESGMGASIGNAFKLSDDDFTRCVEFLNRVDPRGTAIDAARDGK